MTNFNNFLSPTFKKLFDDAIDAIIDKNGLTVPCKIKYAGQQNSTYCNNCIFDPISRLSSNIYNNTGPSPFVENSICPVCMGMGMTDSDSSETINLAVIFDSKYWLNQNKYLNVPDGTVQTICLSSLLPKIRNANEIIFDTNIEKYGNYIYQRMGDPEPAGLSNHRYIITMWKRK